MKTFTIAAATVAYLAAEANAFWGTAHLLISRRAQAILEAENPTVLDAALAELAVLAKYYPTLVKENNNPFTECATFADDIKGQGYSFQSNWHYINKPYLDEEGTTLDDFSFTQPEEDVVGALSAYTKFLKGEIKASDTTYTQQVADKFSYDSDQRSFALRMIIHYVGDVHQPLHSTALVDSEYPSGDRGGTSEKIPSKDGVSSLHFVWDSVLYKYTGRPQLPLSDTDFAWYTSEAASLASSFPTTESKVLAGDYLSWANESYELSVDDVYPDFVEGEDPDQAYIDKSLAALEEHMMYGGERLAAIMVDIYGSQAESFLQ